MGRLGRDRVFIVRDEEAAVKVPSDFAGMTIAHYKGSRVKDDGESAIRQACDKIAEEIEGPRAPQLVGTWRSRYAMLGDLDHREVIDELRVSEAPGGIYIDSLASKIEPYSAKGRFVNGQIIGEWQHKSGENYVDGTFMLVVSPSANYMYGYCTGRADDNAMTFVTWVMARGGTEEEISRLLTRGQQALKERTIVLPQPTSSDPTRYVDGFRSYAVLSGGLSGRPTIAHTENC